MKLYTVKQAMDILGIKQATMYRLLSEHQIPHVKIGGRKQINESDLNEYIKRNTSRPPPIIDDVKNIKKIKYVPGMKIV